MDRETKLSLLMKSLTKFYENPKYINRIKTIIYSGEKEDKLSLRILDWFITNYSKKYGTIIYKKNGDSVDVYMQYKLMLKAFNKKLFDPFNRQNKIDFCYGDDPESYIETSTGQLCFFKWCFENDILDFVASNYDIIEEDMKRSLLTKKEPNASDISTTSSGRKVKRQPLSIPAGRSLSKQNGTFIIRFD